MQKAISRVFFAFGLMLFIFGLYLSWERINPSRLSFKVTSDLLKNNSESKHLVPIRVIISSVKIDLSVIPAVIRKSKWEDTKDGVSYLLSSSLPTEIGNAVFYGHNWSNLLGNLVKVKPADKVEIIMSDGQKLYFKVVYTSVVTPDQTHVILPTKDKRITVYTCTGLFDNKRFVVTAIPTD